MQARTIAEWIECVARQFERAGLHFGHGTDNARDEAAWLVLHAAGAPIDGRFEDWGSAVDPVAAEAIDRLARERCESGQPLAYLLGEAWFAGLAFEVTTDVLVPRSPIAELIEDGFQPFLAPAVAHRALDLCTGSGCIAIATAYRLPSMRVDAVDISQAALAVAARNVRRHGLEGRVNLVRSDLFEALAPTAYDLVVANPPYVPSDDWRSLPGEYRSEPALGLVAGEDGLDIVLRILRDAADWLTPGGILVCEVGESEERLARALPEVPFLWLEFARGGSGVFLLARGELEASRAAVEALMGDRKHVA